MGWGGWALVIDEHRFNIQKLGGEGMGRIQSKMKLILRIFILMTVSVCVCVRAHVDTHWCTGEPFTEEELDEMMSQAIDPEKGYIPYLAYANIMAPEDD